MAPVRQVLPPLPRQIHVYYGDHRPSPTRYQVLEGLPGSRGVYTRIEVDRVDLITVLIQKKFGKEPGART